MLATTGVAAVSALAGCGGGGGTEENGDGGGGGESGDATVTVGAEGESHFSPQSVEIAVGETVVWESVSPDHQIRPQETPEGADWSGMGASFLGEGQTYSHTFETAGTYTYSCSTYHSSAEPGTVEVTE
ncbi:blue (type 1) copper domain-containing protein [Salinarchaeum sp. Harcht-Bsk1]|uniref:cupredoxin domain-containing protein n=1 Tax=Salinarchaeum sp. Harcht-Bsk1 TaxID=1333523 RepID=UPI00034237A9|nr:plastocyanin/azurin family copper-binding protein [Salinarchaeum sp. Harcht-Bsk1]AGN02131.1 blue (type 1) copper domain-containing protein [Salinarchaeum sp. Harcht-Bsk1]